MATGSLSPVSDDSFTTALPRSTRQSHGTRSAASATIGLGGGCAGAPGAAALSSGFFSMAFETRFPLSETRSPGRSSSVLRSSHRPMR